MKKKMYAIYVKIGFNYEGYFSGIFFKQEGLTEIFLRLQKEINDKVRIYNTKKEAHEDYRNALKLLKCEKGCSFERYTNIEIVEVSVNEIRTE